MLMASGLKTEDIIEELAPTSLSGHPRLCPLLHLETPLASRVQAPMGGQLGSGADTKIILGWIPVVLTQACAESR